MSESFGLAHRCVCGQFLLPLPNSIAVHFLFYAVTELGNSRGNQHRMQGWANPGTRSHAIISIPRLDTSLLYPGRSAHACPVTRPCSLYWKPCLTPFVFQCISIVHRQWPHTCSQRGHFIPALCRYPCSKTYTYSATLEGALCSVHLDEVLKCEIALCAQIFAKQCIWP